jgi:hypothetical protein
MFRHSREIPTNGKFCRAVDFCAGVPGAQLNHVAEGSRKPPAGFGPGGQRLYHLQNKHAFLLAFGPITVQRLKAETGFVSGEQTRSRRRRQSGIETIRGSRAGSPSAAKKDGGTRIRKLARASYNLIETEDLAFTG